MTTNSADKSGTTRANIVQRLRRHHLDVFALLWLPYAYLVWRFWFVTDDAFISFRYAKNLALGHGLRYNLTEQVPVEGYSNFLWVLVGGLVEFLRLDVTFWMPLLAALSGTTLMYLVFKTLHTRLGIGLVTTSIVILTLSCFPPFALWSSSGLETMPFALLVYLIFYGLVLRKEGIAVTGASISGLLLTLLRVEGIFWVLLMAGLAYLSRRMAAQRNIRPIVIFLLVVVAGYALYLGWRYSYYHELIPNSVHAKSGLPASFVTRGFAYVAVHFLTFLTPFLLLVTSYFGLKARHRDLGLPVVAMAWAFPAYAVLVTGDFMAMGRLLVPGLVFNAMLLAWMLDDLDKIRVYRRGLLQILGAVVIVLGILPGWDCHLVPHAVRTKIHFRHNTKVYRGEYAQWRFQENNRRDWEIAGKALKVYAAKHLEPAASVVSSKIGVVGYYSDLEIIDVCGLVTQDIARREWLPEDVMMSPGHDMAVDIPYLLKYNPTILRYGIITGDDTRTVANEVQKRADMLKNHWPEEKLERRYVQDFVKIDSPGQDPSSRYLILWRRIFEGADWQHQWRDFETRLHLFATSGKAPILLL